jgi:hypothetical protein
VSVTKGFAKSVCQRVAMSLLDEWSIYRPTHQVRWRFVWTSNAKFSNSKFLAALFEDRRDNSSDLPR